MACQRQSDATAASAEVQREQRALELLPSTRKELPAMFSQNFGFRAGDKDIAVDLDLQAAERRAPDDVLQWFAAGAAPDVLAHRIEFRRRQLAFEIEIQPQSRRFQNVSEEQLDLQTRRLNSFSSQEFGAALNDFQYGHGAAR